MFRVEDIPSGIAKQALKLAIMKRATRKVVLKDSKAFLAFQGELQQAMTRSWDDEMRKGIAGALDRLRDLGPGIFTKADGATILAALEERIGKAAIIAAMRDPIISASDGLYRAGLSEVATAGAVDIVFGRPDIDALDIIKRGNLFAVGNSWDGVTRAKVNNILTECFTTGLTREGLSERLATDLASMGEKTRSYWDNLADHFSTKGRELGRVSAYERAGVDFVQIRAELDDDTTEICRGLHGRVIPVAKLVQQKNTYLAAVDSEDQLGANAAWLMNGASADFSTTPTAKLSAAIGSPPYHFKCRTITVAYFAARDSVDERVTRAVYDRADISAADAKALRQRAAKATWPSNKVALDHQAKHAASTGRADVVAYGKAALDLVKDKDAKMRLSIRRGIGGGAARVILTFAKPATSPSGKAGFYVTAVDQASGKLITHHFRKKLGVGRDDVPARAPTIKKKGLLTWLLG